MTLPVSQVGEVLLDAWRAQVTGLTFVYGVGRIIGVEWGGVWEASIVRVGTRLPFQFGGDDAGAYQRVWIKGAIGREKYGSCAIVWVVHCDLLTCIKVVTVYFVIYILHGKGFSVKRCF